MARRLHRPGRPRDHPRRHRDPAGGEGEVRARQGHRRCRRARGAASSAEGLAFVHAGGTVIERELGPDETLRVDTGCLAAFADTVDYDIQFVGGFRNALFGGEGLFLAKLTGPGRVYLQSLPFSRLADRIFAASRFYGNQGESRGVGGSGLLGGLLSGDR